MSAISMYLNQKKQSAKRKFYLPNHKNISKVLFSLLCTLAGGILFGGIFCILFAQQNAQWVQQFAKAYLEGFQAQPLWNIFSKTFFSNLAYQSILFFCGLSCIGVPIVYLLIFLKGIALSSLCYYLYFSFGLKGIFYHLFLILLPLFIELVAVVLVAYYACFSAHALFRANMLAKMVATVPHTVRLVQCFWVSIGLLLIASCVQGILSKALFQTSIGLVPV